MATTEIVVTIKCSNADKTEITCSASTTVIEFKKLIAEKLNIPAEQQRLIYKGRILKDENSLEQYDVQTGHTIHMVKSGGAQSAAANSQATGPSQTSATPAPSQPTASPFGFPGGLGGSPFGNAAGMGDLGQFQNQLMQNPEMVQQMLNSPMMQSLLNNPEMMNSMILNNPQLQSMMEANPQIRHILNDPELMRQSLQMMSNPNAMQEAMRHQDLAMSRLENHPEGFNALRRMYEDVQEPLMEASQNAFQNQPAPQQSQQSTNPWQTNAPNTSALPNPWGQRPANPFPTPNSASQSQGGMGFGGLPGMGGFPGGMPNMNDPAAISAMMQNPMMQQMLQNPELMMQMARMNPQLNSMLQANPQLQSVLSDPETLRRMADPANLQAMMQLQQSMQQLQRSGLAPAGGLGMPPMGTGMFPTFPAPAAAPTSGGSTTIGGLDFSSLLSGTGAPPPSTASFSAPPSATSRSPEVRFESQLQQLEGMGFTDREANIRALIASNGNVNAAVERLLQ